MAGRRSEPGTTWQQAPQDNTRWGLNRIGLSSDVAPQRDAHFSIAATAPATAGRNAFQWRMLQEGVEWFGDYTPTILIDVVPPAGQTTVPDVVGMARMGADQAIRGADLVPRFTGVTTPPSEVSRQTPAAGTVVDRGSVVTVYMVRLN